MTGRRGEGEIVRGTTCVDAYPVFGLGFGHLFLFFEGGKLYFLQYTPHMILDLQTQAQITISYILVFSLESFLQLLISIVLLPRNVVREALQTLS